MGRQNYALLTGAFILLLVAATAVIIYWLGHFERQRDLYVVATRASVSGLNPESTVFFRGISVGKVLKIAFDPHDTSIILVPIEVDKHIVLPLGVFATLRLKGVTGLTQIQLEVPSRAAGQLKPGDSPERRIPLVPSATDRLLDSGEDLLKKADHLMQRLSAILTPENEKNISDILTNLKTLSYKLKTLQDDIDKALAGVPALSADAHQSLSKVNQLSTQAHQSLVHLDSLTADLKGLTQEVRKLAMKGEHLANTSTTLGDELNQTTLPKIDKLLSDLQATVQQVKKVANMLESNPQTLLLGPGQQDVGPGEPGFRERP